MKCNNGDLTYYCLVVFDCDVGYFLRQLTKERASPASAFELVSLSFAEGL